MFVWPLTWSTVNSISRNQTILLNEYNAQKKRTGAVEDFQSMSKIPLYPGLLLSCGLID